MPEIPKNIPSPDISDVLSTYKSHPTEADNAGPKGLIIAAERKNTVSQDEIIQIPKYETLFEKTIYFVLIVSRQGIKMLEIIMNGSVRLAKVGAWCIAIFGSLFVALLATNTMNQATEIINTSILAKIGKITETDPKTVSKETPITPATKTGTTTNQLQSSALQGTTPVDTPTILDQKRAALLEARKTARLQQEKLKAAENSLSQ